MKFKFLFFGLLILSNVVWATDCPVKYDEEGYVDKVATAIHATSSCIQASELAEACSLGASGDLFIAVAAERKCGLDFWNKLSNKDKEIYNQLQAKCNKKYENKDGSMYISFKAFCRLEVAKLYSDLYTPDRSDQGL